MNNCNKLHSLFLKAIPPIGWAKQAKPLGQRLVNSMERLKERPGGYARLVRSGDSETNGINGILHNRR